MHSLTICFGPSGTVWNLLFKTNESLEKAREALSDSILPSFFLKDDFGNAIAITRDAIHAFLIEDLDQSQLGQIERGLHQARTQAKAETRAMSDEVIKGAMRAKQMGPAVMAPVPGGRFNG